MRHVAAALALLLALPAQAGGLGLLITGGTHTERMWYYTDHDYSDNQATPVNDEALYPKFEMNQTLPHYGAGMELILGDRDDRFQGTFRWYYLGDAPQRDPAQATKEPLVLPEHVIADHRDQVKHLGIGLVGLNWGFLDISDTMRFGVAAHLGSGFLTNDHTEFLLLDVGPQLTWRASRNVVMYTEVPWQMRWRKGMSNGVDVFVGARYMFD